MALSTKQEAFVREYLIDGNATQAAARAGYKGSPDALGVIGHENLRKPKIAALLAKVQAKRAERTEVTADRIVKELAYIAFQRPGQYLEDDGSLKPLSQLGEAAQAAISSLDVVTKYVGDEETGLAVEIGRVKTWDKGKALDTLVKIQGLVTEKTQHSFDFSGMSDADVLTARRLLSAITND